MIQAHFGLSEGVEYCDKHFICVKNRIVCLCHNNCHSVVVEYEFHEKPVISPEGINKTECRLFLPLLLAFKCTHGLDIALLYSTMTGVCTFNSRILNLYLPKSILFI